jgi:benzoate-CoA ligase family protein
LTEAGGGGKTARHPVIVAMPLPPLAEPFNAAAFFLDRHVEEGRGARIAMRSGAERVTYAALAERASRIGHALGGLGVEVEHRVLLALDDGPVFAAAFWGTVKLGAVAVPVNTLMTPAEYAFLLNDSRARVLVAEPEVAARVATIRHRCPFLRAVVASGAAPPGCHRLDDLVARAPSTLAPAPTRVDDVMYWGYTSGSTGPPKAAVHVHRAFVAAAELVGRGVFGLGPDDVTFSASKLSFAFGLGNSLYFPAHVGAASVLVPERLTPERAFAVIAAERPTVFFAVATLYARMLQVEDAARRWDLSSLRLCVSSGEVLPPPVFDAWHARTGHELVDVLGSTETLHDFIANRPGAVRRGSVGRLVPGFEARVVDDVGQPVPAGVFGHLLVKGPTTAPCYWNRLDRTRATMQGEWLRTGDVLARDADGWFYFGGRSDDMLKVGGHWVSPAEIEARLLEHPAVVEAAVVAREDADGLTTAHASVVLRDGHAGSSALGNELEAFVAARLPRYKVPRSIAVVDALPKTATEKVQRFRLRAAG